MNRLSLLNEREANRTDDRTVDRTRDLSRALRTIVPRRVLLVGYEDQDNLGIRYLSSRLLQDGHHTRIVAFGDDPEPLLRVIQAEQPAVVGFSLIFQYMAPQFGCGHPRVARRGRSRALHHWRSLRVLRTGRSPESDS